MIKVIKYLDNKDNQKSLAFYIIYAIIISALLFIGLGGNANASSIKRTQAVHQNKPRMERIVRKHAEHNHRRFNWFTDGLSKRQLRARTWVSMHESGHRWNILSYGHRCIGYFQLAPSYLSYKHGHINLSHEHQIKVADAYVLHRYGSWVNAKRFWQAHHWY